MLNRSLLSVRNIHSRTYQIRWKSHRPIRPKQPSDHGKYSSPAFVSINRRQPPVSNASPTAIEPSNSKSPAQASVKPNEPSLFTELFPEEARKKNNSQSSSDDLAAKVPPLELPTVAELLDGVEGYHPSHLFQSKATSKEAWSDAKSHKKTTLLVLELASKSLIESDFRRIAPKGDHINGWTGLGDILRVFPARDPGTFEQMNHYFIIFANPAYARAYQSHVHRLYRFARKHTPTSIESPLALQPGEKFIPGERITDEDAYTMLQDFTLCPTSQRMQLKYIYGVLTPGMRALIQRGGYLKLPDGTDRAGRAVLFWVEGHQPTPREINDLIALDGRKRGMSWEVSVDKLDTSAELPPDADESVEFGEETDGAEVGPQRRGPHRWVLTFSDENEARRFIRAWHKRELSPLQPDEPRVVQAEFLW